MKALLVAWGPSEGDGQGEQGPGHEVDPGRVADAVRGVRPPMNWDVAEIIGVARSVVVVMNMDDPSHEVTPQPGRRGRRGLFAEAMRG